MSKRSRKGVARNPPAVEVPWDQITEEMRCQFCQQGKTKDILKSGKLYKLISGKRPIGVYSDCITTFVGGTFVFFGEFLREFCQTYAV